MLRGTSRCPVLRGGVPGGAGNVGRYQGRCLVIQGLYYIIILYIIIYNYYINN